MSVSAGELLFCPPLSVNFTASAVSVLPPGWWLRLTIAQPLGWGQRERNCNSEGFHQIQAPNSSLFYSIHLEDDILTNRDVTGDSGCVCTCMFSVVH